MASTIVGCSSAASNASANQTIFMQMLNSVRFGYIGMAEDLAYFKFLRGDLKLKNLTTFVETNNRTPTSITTRKNSALGASSVAYADSETGVKVDAVNEETFVSGDTFNAAIITGASAGDIYTRSVIAELESTAGATAYILGAAYNTATQAVALTRYMRLVGNLNSTTATENDSTVQFRSRAPGRAYGFQFTIETMPTADVTITLRKNGADTVMTKTVASGTAAGPHIVTDQSVRIANGDLLNIKVVTGAGSGTLELSKVALWVDSDDDQCDIPVSGYAAITGVGARADFFPILGNLAVFDTSTTSWKIRMPFATRIGRLRVLLDAIVSGGNTGTFALRVNGVASALVKAVPSGSAVGWYESARALYVDVVAGDEVDITLTSAGTFNTQINIAAITINYDPTAGARGIVGVSC